MVKTFSEIQESLTPGTNMSARFKKIKEATEFFHGNLDGSNRGKARLEEAFTTDDFPELVAAGFEVQTRAAFREVPDETTMVARQMGVPDTRRHQLRDFFGETYFEDVKEGEEYKSDNPFKLTNIWHGTEKTGRNFALTMERILEGDFHSLANFPGLLGRGAANTRNRKCFRVFLTKDGGFREDSFSMVDTEGLAFETLKDASEYISKQKNTATKSPVDVSTKVLVVPPALGDSARALVGAQGVRETTVMDGTRREIQRSNPLAGIQVQESLEFARQTESDTAWMLLPGQQTDNPSVIHSYLEGYRDVDIRVKRDQGQRIGGGDVGYQEGSFGDDTIWYRGRYFVGMDLAFKYATYASTGDAE